MTEIDRREGARRQHRTVALFAVVQCWVRNLDGVAFTRPQIQRMLGLDRIRGERIGWLKEDMVEYFPHFKAFYLPNTTSVRSVFLCRQSLNQLPRATMTTKERIEGIGEGGPKIGIFSMWPSADRVEVMDNFRASIPLFADTRNYDELMIGSYLALLSQGQISAKHFADLESDTDD